MNITQDGPHNLHARIEANKLALASCYPLPHIPSLEAQVAHYTPKAVLGDAGAKSDLALAVSALDEGRTTLQRHGELKRQQDQLQAELQQFEQDQRAARQQMADRQLQQALDAFSASAEQLCRNYRTLLETHTRLTRTVPGFQPRRMPEFNIPHLNGTWNDFTTSETMTMGQLAFEREAA